MFYSIFTCCDTCYWCGFKKVVKEKITPTTSSVDVYFGNSVSSAGTYSKVTLFTPSGVEDTGQALL